MKNERVVMKRKDFGEMRKTVDLNSSKEFQIENSNLAIDMFRWKPKDGAEFGESFSRFYIIDNEGNRKVGLCTLQELDYIEIDKENKVTTIIGELIKTIVDEFGNFQQYWIDDGSYYKKDGKLAAKDLSITQVPVIIREDLEDEQLKKLLATNFGRMKNNPNKQRKVAVQYVELCGLKNGEKLGNNCRALSQQDIAKQLGISERGLRDLLEIERKLTPEIKDLLDTGIISKTSASKIWTKLSETEQEEQEFININNDLYCNYSHYNGVDTDYSVVNPNLSYDTVVECNWAYKEEWTQSSIDKVINKQKETLYTNENVEIAIGEDDCTTYICVYLDKKLIGHYNIIHVADKNYKQNNFTEIEKWMSNLFIYENIELENLMLLRELTQGLDASNLDKAKEKFETAKKNADHWLENGDETFIFTQIYSGKGYTMTSYRAIEEIASHTFNHKFGTVDFYFELQKFNDELDERGNENWDKYGIHAGWAILNMRSKSYEEQTKRYKYEEESRKSYDNYDYSKMFSGSSTSLNESEQKIFNKMYKIAIMKLHPDLRVIGDGHVLQFKDTLQMDVLSLLVIPPTHKQLQWLHNCISQ